MRLWTHYRVVKSMPAYKELACLDAGCDQQTTEHEIAFDKLEQFFGENLR